MEFPKISIVTPSFNQGHYLERTIKSILDQNYPNLEYIIIDGGSTDNSVEIIKKYEDKITFWKSEKDRGMYDAINQGLAMATGEIQAWLNSDDIYLNGCLFTVAEIFAEYTQIKWLTSNRLCVNEKDRIVSNNPTPSVNLRQFITGSVKIIQQEATFWRSELFNQQGPIPLNIKYAGDYFLWTQFYEVAQLTIVRTVFSAFRYRKNNQTTLDHMETYMDEVHQVRRELKARLFDSEVKESLVRRALRRFRLLSYLNKFGLFKKKVSEEIFTKRPIILHYNRSLDKYRPGKNHQKNLTNLEK